MVQERIGAVESPHFPPDEGTAMHRSGYHHHLSQQGICPLWPHAVSARIRMHGAVRGSAGMAPPGERMLSVDAGVL